MPYLLANRNPYGDRFYRSRRQPITCIVLHITAGLEDLGGGSDQSAENTARYAASTNRLVSWHVGVDTDSIVRLLPDGFTAYHCKGFNSRGLGLEISKKDTNWSRMPDDWIAATLSNAADICREWVRLYGIPLRLITRAEAARGVKGFLYHSTADPQRRSDPGRDFPIDVLFRLIGSPEYPKPREDDGDMITPESPELSARKRMQADLDWCWYRLFTREERKSHAERTRVWRIHLDPDEGGGCGQDSGGQYDGVWGPATQAILEAVAWRLGWWEAKAIRDDGAGKQVYRPHMRDEIREVQHHMGEPYGIAAA